MAAKLFTVPSPVAFNSRGLASPGATASFFTTGTTTAVNVYSDSGLSVSLGSTITSDAIGRFPIAYQSESTPYRVIIADADGVELADVDPYYFGASNVAGSIALTALENIATNKLLGRATAGTGAVEQIDLTAAGRALIDDATAAAQRTTLDVPSNADLAAAVAAVSIGNGAQTGFVSGGQAIWVSGFTYKVTAASYLINGVLYTSTEQSITLTAADVTFDRIDVLALDTSGTLVKITGTAAAAPSEPDIDPATQIEVTFVTVGVSASAPATATNESVYLEDAEWTTAVTGTHISKNSTSNPRTGTKDVEATSAVTGDSILFNKGSTVSASSYTALVFYIRNKTASWGTTRLRLHFQSASGVRVGNIVSVLSGTFGFSTANTSSYQAVSIPLSNFAIPAGGSIQKLNLAVTGSTAVGWYIDDMVLQLNGAGSGSTSGLTQTQADARYAQRSANLSDLGSASTARTNLGLPAVAATVAASKIVGRGSAAGSGAPQEITLGTGLFMSGTTLSASASGPSLGLVAAVASGQVSL